MSDTLVDLKTEFDVPLLGRLFEVLRERPSDGASDMSGIVTLLYVAGTIAQHLAANGRPMDDDEFLRLAQEAILAARQNTGEKG